jgi:hypothetical protein
LNWQAGQARQPGDEDQAGRWAANSWEFQARAYNFDMPHRRPGWALPNGHVVRSQSEAALCNLLDAADIGHDHWALGFDVPATATEWHLFVPSIRLTDLTLDGRTVLIEPVNSLQIGGGLRRLSAFRRRFGAGYCVLVITRRAFHRRLPSESYDALFDIEALEELTGFLRAPASDRLNPRPG